MLVSQKRKQSLCGVYSEREFRAILNYERKRADRTGGKFSLALFEIDPEEEDVRQACLIPDAIKEVVRSTDEVGWFDKHHIGMLLIDTPLKGTFEVIKKFSEATILRQYLTKYHIFSYPSHYFPVAERPLHESSAWSGFQHPNLFEETEIQPIGKNHQGDCSVRGSIIQGSEEAYLECVSSKVESHLGIDVPFWKRIFDISSTSVALIFLMPLMVLIAVLIKSVSPGPVLFRQERIGYLGRPFTLLKFRTMKADTDPSEHEDYVRGLIRNETVMAKLHHDARLIPLGRFLRSSGMDELPQLFHVLSGKMSLVGPRPCLPAEFQEYLHWHKRRFYTLPGITGLWQVEGKNKLAFQEMIRKDIAYEQKRSLKMDLAILLKTIPAVVMLTSDG